MRPRGDLRFALGQENIGMIGLFLRDRPHLFAKASACLKSGNLNSRVWPVEIAACCPQRGVFVLPSTGEGFGFVFVEAMAFGKPVVAASAGGVTDIVVHEENGLLVAPNDLGELVRALERLLGSESLRLELGRRGHELVRSKFRFDSFRSQIEDILWQCG